MKEEIGRLRGMVSQCGVALQKLALKINPPPPNLTSYGVNEVVEDLQAKLKTEFPKDADAIEWQVEAQGGTVEIDPQLLQEAFLELFRNAFEHRKNGSSLLFIANREGDNLVFSLHEQKAEFTLSTNNWGREPLRHVNRGHYGLGLNRARTIVEGQGGTLQAQYDSTGSKLITQIRLPLTVERV